MSDAVEGEWKNFVFKMAKSEDTPRIFQVLRKHFYPNEPLCSQMATTEHEFDVMAEDFKPLVLAQLKDNISFYAQDKESGKIAGVRIMGIARKDEDPEPVAFKTASCEVIVNSLVLVSGQANIFEAYPDIDHYCDLFMTAVDSEYRGQGLATEMYIRAMKLLQTLKIPLCKSVLTSPFTQKACKNLKFTEHARLYLRDYKDEDGNPYFPAAPPDQFITVAAKRL